MSCIGRSKLANLLISEDARAEQLLAAAIAVAIFICLTLDGWTAAANQSVYASNVVCEGDKGRSSAFYDAQDFSEEHHTGEFIAGVHSCRIKVSLEMSVESRLHLWLVSCSSYVLLTLS